MSEAIQAIRIGKGYVNYRGINYPKMWKDHQPDKGCPLCNQGFNIGDQVLMVITNNAFPNTTIHKSCVDHDLILTTHALSKSYDTFAGFNRTHKGWSWVTDYERR